MNDYPPYAKRSSGCLTTFLVGLCVTWSLVVGAIGGVISYFVAQAGGAASISSSIGGAMAAFAVVWLASPAGVAMMFLFLPNQSGSVIRSFAALLAALLFPILFTQLIFVFAALAALAGGLLFRWCPPLTAAILMGTVFPLLGAIVGVLVGNPEPSPHS